MKYPIISFTKKFKIKFLLQNILNNQLEILDISDAKLYDYNQRIEEFIHPKLTKYLFDPRDYISIEYPVTINQDFEKPILFNFKPYKIKFSSVDILELPKFQFIYLPIKYIKILATKIVDEYRDLKTLQDFQNFFDNFLRNEKITTLKINISAIHFILDTLSKKSGLFKYSIISNKLNIIIEAPRKIVVKQRLASIVNSEVSNQKKRLNVYKSKLLNDLDFKNYNITTDIKADDKYLEYSSDENVNQILKKYLEILESENLRDCFYSIQEIKEHLYNNKIIIDSLSIANWIKKVNKNMKRFKVFGENYRKKSINIGEQYLFIENEYFHSILEQFNEWLDINSSKKQDIKIDHLIDLSIFRSWKKAKILTFINIFNNIGNNPFKIKYG